MQIKLRNERAQKRKLEKGLNIRTSERSEQLDQNVNSPVFLTDDTIIEDLEILESVFLPDEIELAKEKIYTTLQYRRAESKKRSVAITEYPFFCICPQLIAFDFFLSWGDNNISMVTEWPKYGPYICTAVKNNGQDILVTETDRSNGN